MSLATAPTYLRGDWNKMPSDMSTEQTRPLRGETPSKRPLMAGLLSLTVALTTLLGFPSTANAESADVQKDPGLSCVEAASDAAAQQQLSGGYDFACAGNAVVVEPLSPQAAALAEGTSESARELALSTMANVADCNMPDPSYWRAIISELEEQWENCIVFGRRQYEGGPILWIDSIRHSGTFFPGWAWHQYKFRIAPYVHAPTGLSYDAALYRNHNIGVPTEVSFHSYSDVVSGYGGDSGVTTEIDNFDQNKEGTFHFRLHKFRVTVPSESFDVELADAYDHVGHRFLCLEDEDEPWLSQCRWPDGEEAPVF